MHLIDFKCPNCSAPLHIDADAKEALCEFCGSSFLLNEKTDVEHAKKAQKQCADVAQQQKGGQKTKTRQQTKAYFFRLTFSAMLIALYFVLDRFTAINLLTNQYKLSFIPLMLSGIMLGPLWGAAVGGLGDFLSAIIMPTGAYFPGFTVVNALMGMTFGLLCHKKLTLARGAIAAFLCQGIGGLILNTLNLSIYFIVNGIDKYGNSILPIVSALAATRAIQAGVYLVAEIAFVVILMQLKPRWEKYIFAKF